MAETLLLFSGGLDSTTALVKLLRETHGHIHVHYIHYQSLENRYEAEAKSVKKLIPKIQYENRIFSFSESLINCLEFTSMTDIQVVRFMAAQICWFNHRITHIAAGKCKDDETFEYYARLNRANKIFDACTFDHPTKLEWIYPVGQMTKMEEIAYLKKEMPELLELVHYCRRPILKNDEWWNCGECITCNQTASADNEVYSIKVLKSNNE